MFLLKIFTCIRNNSFAFSICWKKTVVKLSIDGVVSFKFIEISIDLPYLNDFSPHVGQMIIEAFIGTYLNGLFIHNSMHLSNTLSNNDRLSFAFFI